MIPLNCYFSSIFIVNNLVNNFFSFAVNLTFYFLVFVLIFDIFVTVVHLNFLTLGQIKVISVLFSFTWGSLMYSTWTCYWLLLDKIQLCTSSSLSLLLVLQLSDIPDAFVKCRQSSLLCLTLFRRKKEKQIIIVGLCSWKSSTLSQISVAFCQQWWELCRSSRQ